MGKTKANDIDIDFTSTLGKGPKGVSMAKMNPEQDKNDENSNDLHRSVKPHTKNGQLNPSTNSNGNVENQAKIDEERQDVMVNEFPIHNAPKTEECKPKLSKIEDSLFDEQAKVNTDNVDSSSKVSSQKRLTEYARFYKYYYEKLKSEHPAWNNVQITTIVSLQWKKRKIIQKEQKGQLQKVQIGATGGSVISRRTTSKPITGQQARRRYYKDTRTAEYLQVTWKQLPQESKNYWKRQGDIIGSSSVAGKVSDAGSVKNHATSQPNHLMKMMLGKIM